MNLLQHHGEIDQVIFAGLGETSIVRILERSSPLTENRIRRMIFCPSASYPEGILLPWLRSQKWKLVQQDLLKVRHRWYLPFAVEQSDLEFLADEREDYGYYMGEDILKDVEKKERAKEWIRWMMEKNPAAFEKIPQNESNRTPKQKVLQAILRLQIKLAEK